MPTEGHLKSFFQVAVDVHYNVFLTLKRARFEKTSIFFLYSSIAPMSGLSVKKIGARKV